MAVTGRDLRVVDGAYTGDPDAPVGPPDPRRLGPLPPGARRPVPARRAAGPVHRAPADRRRPAPARRRRPGPGPPHAVDGHQRHRHLVPRRGPRRPVDALPPPLDLRRRRHDPRGVPGARRGRRGCWRRSPSTPWSAPSPGRRPRPGGTGCEPDHRPGAAEPPPRRAVQPPGARGVAYLEPFRRRVRGLDGDGTVVDSERVLLVHRAGQPPTYAFPAADVRAGLAGAEPEPDAPGYVQVPWDAVDTWYEEDEQVFGHPRNPYHRVDCVRTRRRLRVEVAGTTLVDTDATLGVYETALDPRLYVARDRVRTDLLVPSDTTTYCPYKGTASYWSAVIGDTTVADVAWSYERPLPESLPLARPARLRPGPGHGRPGAPAHRRRRRVGPRGRSCRSRRQIRPHGSPLRSAHAAVLVRRPGADGPSGGLRRPDGHAGGRRDRGGGRLGLVRRRDPGRLLAGRSSGPAPTCRTARWSTGRRARRPRWAGRDGGPPVRRPRRGPRRGVPGRQRHDRARRRPDRRPQPGGGPLARGRQRRHPRRRAGRRRARGGQARAGRHPGRVLGQGQPRGLPRARRPPPGRRRPGPAPDTP